jgi:hypothetical protein
MPRNLNKIVLMNLASGKLMIDNIWAMSSANGIAGTVNYFQPPPLPDLRMVYRYQGEVQ